MNEDAEKLQALRQLHDCGTVGVPEPRRPYTLVRLRNDGIATMRQKEYRGSKWWVFTITPHGSAIAAAVFG